MKYLQYGVVLMLLLVTPILCSDCDESKNLLERPTTIATTECTTTKTAAPKAAATTTTCSTTPACPVTTTACAAITTVCSSSDSTPNTLVTAVATLQSTNDCSSRPDKTVLVDARHCRRYYICEAGRAKRYRCGLLQWFDRKTLTCRARGLVTNCPVNKN